MGDRDVNVICLSCPLLKCVGIEKPECPIRVEQRRRWREKMRRYKGVNSEAFRKP
jgi:hypothetical protein